MRHASSGVILLALFPLLFGSPQKHPSIAPGAQETSARHLHSMLAKGAKILIIDVRTPKEYSRSHVPGAVNIPITELPQRMRKMHISKETTIVTMCDHGGRSSRAALQLQEMGYRTAAFCRIDSWKKDGYQIKKQEPKNPPESRVRELGDFRNPLAGNHPGGLGGRGSAGKAARRECLGRGAGWAA